MKIFFTIISLYFLSACTASLIEVGENPYFKASVAAPTPTPVLKTAQALKISNGGKHSCLINSNGGVKCWGINDYGQLGNGTTSNLYYANSTTSLESGFKFISEKSMRSCAISNSGELKCWGDNSNGELGNNSTVATLVPTSANILTNSIDQVVLGMAHTCVTLTLGGIKCWGWNGYGNLGNNTNESSLTPVSVSGISSSIKSISSGNFHTCIVLNNSTAKCWGKNSYGQLGNNSNSDSYVPSSVNDLLNNAISISAGDDHTCVVTSYDGVKCWGKNDQGQLGNGSTSSSNSPVDVIGLDSNIAQVSAGSNFSCALTKDGKVKCWGSNNKGQLGVNNGALQTSPVDVTNVTSTITSISAGSENICALTFDNRILCWGNNSSGQSGRANPTDSFMPTEIQESL